LVLTDEETIVIPGHGNIGLKADLNDYNQRTIKWKNLIVDLYNQGKSIEAIVENEESFNMLLAFAAGSSEARMLKKESIRSRVKYVIDTEIRTTLSFGASDLQKYEGEYLRTDSKIIKLKVINGCR